jgi:hypothetical protein
LSVGAHAELVDKISLAKPRDAQGSAAQIFPDPFALQSMREQRGTNRTA